MKLSTAITVFTIATVIGTANSKERTLRRGLEETPWAPSHGHRDSSSGDIDNTMILEQLAANTAAIKELTAALQAVNARTDAVNATATEATERADAVNATVFTLANQTELLFGVVSKDVNDLFNDIQDIKTDIFDVNERTDAVNATATKAAEDIANINTCVKYDATSFACTIGENGDSPDELPLKVVSTTIKGGNAINLNSANIDLTATGFFTPGLGRISLNSDGNIEIQSAKSSPSVKGLGRVVLDNEGGLNLFCVDLTDEDCSAL